LRARRLSKEATPSFYKLHTGTAAGTIFLATMRSRLHLALQILTLLTLPMSVACSLGDAQAQPPKGLGPLLEYAGSWGAKGALPWQLADPVSISTDTVGNVYIVDAGSLFIHKFSPQGTPLLSFQKDPLRHPEWITLDRGGAIYVSDPARSSIFIFLPDGDHYRELRLRTRSKENMVSVAVGWDGLIHVLDSSAAKVFTFTPRLRLVQSWQPAGTSSDSRAQPGPIEMGPEGDLYVANAGTIMRFTREGHLVSEIGANSSGSGARWSDKFAVSGNYIFVMGIDGRQLHVWTLDGKPKLDLDLAPQLGQGARPAPALAVSPKGELLVLDAQEARVLRYRINF
jgi:hypothetical protein